MVRHACRPSGNRKHFGSADAGRQRSIDIEAPSTLMKMLQATVWHALGNENTMTRWHKECFTTSFETAASYQNEGDLRFIMEMHG